MRTINAGFLFSLALSATLLLAGCSKDAPATSTNNTTSASERISDQDVSQSISNAVSGSGSGLATQVEATTKLTAMSLLGCGQTIDSTISASSPTGALFGYSYDLNYSRTCICSGGSPSQYDVTITGSSSYSFLVMSSSDSTNAQFTVAGIAVSAANYVLNGAYTRTGTIQSSITTQHTFNGTITFTGSNITVSKSTQQIISGSATVLFSGSTLSGGTTTQNATITFLGNNEATVVVGNGTPTTISW